MFSVKIRDHMMIAHSLPSEAFGPAQGMHGATYVVDAIFRSPTLDKDNIVIDIGIAHEVLKAALAPLNYQNLDELPQFKRTLTTTEFLAKYIHDQIKENAQTRCDFTGSVEVVLGESHIAWASYAG